MLVGVELGSMLCAITANRRQRALRLPGPQTADDWLLQTVAERVCMKGAHRISVRPSRSAGSPVPPMQGRRSTRFDRLNGNSRSTSGANALSANTGVVAVARVICPVLARARSSISAACRALGVAGQVAATSGSGLLGYVLVPRRSWVTDSAGTLVIVGARATARKQTQSSYADF